MLTVDEGSKSLVYKDTKGKATVGIGFNMDDGNAQNVWKQANIPESFSLVKSGTSELSKESSWKLLTVCVDNCKKDLAHFFPAFDTLHNMGSAIFSQFHTFIRLIKDNDYVGASSDLGNTSWATQVGKRKNRVMALLLEDDSLYS